jgi:hypothetical protein
MKIRILTLLLTLGLITFTSCNNDNDSSQIETLNGIWNLKNVSGGFAGINEDFENGIITWTFNSHNSTLTVENNNSQVSIYSGYENGTYPYSTVENNGNEYILINTAEVGRYILSIKNLTINENEIQSGSGADGFILEFER